MNRRVLTGALAPVVGLALTAGLAACTPTPTPSPSPTTPIVVSPTPSVPMPDPSTSSPAPTPAEPTLPPEDVAENVRDSVTSGDTRALASWMADSVVIALAASEGMGTVSPDEAATWIHDAFPVPGTSWDFALDEAIVDEYRAHFYVEWFPEGVVVGRTLEEEPHVIALTIEDGHITRVLMALEDVLYY